ncbi:MAG TPA: glycoside hydrolase family 15 protein [Gaiellaceae bacterium]|nr:glycoside hydrolase family 15 protein [Gaiellaceae bacterium]
MELATPRFSPLEPVDGYLPIEDHGLVGDGRTAALVGRDGAVSWLCVPRFDSPPLLCSLLDDELGGRFLVAPEGVEEARQRYEDGTGVLVTELRADGGAVALTDAMTLGSGADLREDAPAARGELVRVARVLDGRVRLRVELDPRGGAEAERAGEGIVLRPAGGEELHLAANAELGGLRTVHELETGDELRLVLRWGGGPARRADEAPELLDQTRQAWRRWLERLDYDGPQPALVRRSAITLKLLDHFENGAIVAAPTSSLPEELGGVRNWDYRYAWIRDAAFSVYALRRIGYEQEAVGFLAWALAAAEGDGRPCVLYDLDGNPVRHEEQDSELRGYRGSAPVRWGNGAGGQRQHDVFGEILDCAWQWSRGGREIGPRLWRRLCELVELAGREWRDPDHGIWEVRTSGRPFTYSAALCQVALDRGARLAAELGRAERAERWGREAESVREAILEEAWDEELDSLTEHLGGGDVDAGLLALPLRRVVPADHPRMIRTAARVVERLGVGDGLLYRYLPDASPDGLPGHEGAFLLCSFWLVDNLAGQGRLDESGKLFDSLCARAGPLGLLPEQIDPASGAFLGNYPQAFSHVGLISSGVNLARRLQEADAGLSRA